jgi:hypothetical protein
VNPFRKIIPSGLSSCPKAQTYTCNPIQHKKGKEREIYGKDMRAEISLNDSDTTAQWGISSSFYNHCMA